MDYIELHCRSNFTFLQGASHADELVERASELGYGGLAITDRNTLAGVVRAFTAGRDAGFRTIVGCEVHPVDGPPLLMWPIDRQGYGQLCRLLSVGRLRASKGECSIRWQDVVDHSDRCLAGLLLRSPQEDWLGQAVQEHRMSERFHADLEALDALEPDASECSGEYSKEWLEGQAFIVKTSGPFHRSTFHRSTFRRRMTRVGCSGCIFFESFLGTEAIFRSRFIAESTIVRS